MHSGVVVHKRAHPPTVAPIVTPGATADGSHTHAQSKATADIDSSGSHHSPLHHHHHGHKHKSRKPRRFLKLLGGSALLFVGYGVFLLRDESDKSWQLLLWKTLPLRFLSYLWGSVHRWELPVSLREPLYMAWTRGFHCHLDEILGAEGDWEKGKAMLRDFPNLNSFFIRHIDLRRCRPIELGDTIVDGRVRSIAPGDSMVSPVDGRVNCFGEVDPKGKVDQIKGMSYSVADLLGVELPPAQEGSRYYYYVLYLAPGDYHRMHSPTECTIAERRHFPGALYPVAPSIARYIPSLFVRNERVVLSGSWKHGAFHMVPVGAYNVGSMKLNFDEELDTNLREHTFTQYRPDMDDGLKARPFVKRYTQEAAAAGAAAVVDPLAVAPAASPRATQRSVDAASRAFDASDPAPPPAGSRLPLSPHIVTPAGISLGVGTEFSRFELGSTIVVVFEMDKGRTFNWNIEQEQKIKLGQRIGVILEPGQQNHKIAAPVPAAVVGASIVP